MVTITVITCTYNAEPVLQRTLDSVLRQCYANVEHLIIDGASRDASMDMVGRYAECSARQMPSHRVVAVSEPDRGLYDAMNKGLVKATGDYLVFLNAGDVLPDAMTLQHVAECAGDGTAMPAVVYAKTDIVDMDGRFLRHRRLEPSDGLTWRSFRQGMLVCHQAFYARRELAKEVLYDTSLRFSADVDWCIRIMKLAEQQGIPLRFLDEVVVNYLDGGMTDRNHRASLRERFRVMCRHYGLPVTLAMHGWFVVRALLKR